MKVKQLGYQGEHERPVLKDINVSVRDGCILGIAGVEGNGQAELIEILTRQTNVESGSVEINGQNIKALTVKKLRDTGFGHAQKIAMLSGGNMQKVVVARECDVEPEVLIVIILAFGMILFVSDKPLDALKTFVLGPLSSKRYIGNIIEMAIPLIFSGLAMSVVSYEMQK